MSWIWIDPAVLSAIHTEQLAEHGGGNGLRDQGLYESALARPENLAAYGDPSAFELAAAYGFGIIKNHPFVDGNKRTGFIAAVLFLELNGCQFNAKEIDVVDMVLRVAAGEASEEEFARWLELNCD